MESETTDRIYRALEISTVAVMVAAPMKVMTSWVLIACRSIDLSSTIARTSLLRIQRRPRYGHYHLRSHTLAINLGDAALRGSQAC